MGENRDAIPAELKARPQWLVWREEERAGRRTKVPVNPRTGKLASTTDPRSWCSFEVAVARSAAYAGIGFVFTAADPFFGIDLDGCRDAATGETAPWACELLARFQTYAEVSPSGTGIKLFGQGALPEGAWHKKSLPLAAGLGDKRPAIEVYDRARFFTVTGESVTAAPVAECGTALQALQEQHRTRPGEEMRNAGAPRREGGCGVRNEPNPSAIPNSAFRTPHSLDDAALLEKARAARNGARFARLFDRGDACDYRGDASAADFALATLLAFYTDDAAQIERLARASALRRPKWDEPRPGGTYLSHTIARALATRRDRYQAPARSRPPAPPPRPTNDAAPPASEPSIHQTDLGNAMRLVARHGADLRYSLAHGWLIWTGQRWQRDRTQAVVRFAKETVRQMYADAAALTDPHARKSLAQWALKSEAAPRIQAMVRLAESEPGIPVTEEQLDTNRWLLNTRTGAVDLRTGALRPHRREDLCTKLAPVAYDPAAPCPVFRRFVAEIMAERPELIDYLQRAVGYSLTGDVSEQCLFFLHGLGANGKSTFLDLLLALLGDYALISPGSGSKEVPLQRERN